MNAIVKTTAALTLAGSLVAAAATPTFARSWKPWAAAGAGFAAGAVVGAAAANANAHYYGPGYAYGPGYDSYAYQDTYAYGPAPRYYRYGSQYGYEKRPGCATDGNYNQTDYGAC